MCRVAAGQELVSWSVPLALCGYAEYTVQYLHVLKFLHRCSPAAANTPDKVQRCPCAFGGARLVCPRGWSRAQLLRRIIARSESILLQCSLKAIVCLIHVELELSCLLIVQLLRCSHLIQGDQPLDYLALVLEFLVCNLVHRLNDLDEQRVQCVLLDEAYLDSVKQSDKCLGRVDNERCVSIVALLTCRTRRTLFDSDGDAYAQSFGCSRTVKLSTVLAWHDVPPQRGGRDS